MKILEPEPYHVRPQVNRYGYRNILGIIFFFWGGGIFFWFQVEVEKTFQVGAGCPWRGGRPLKKTAGGGLGVGALRLYLQMHSQNMLRDSPVH